MRGRERGREEDRQLETRVEEVISGSFCVMHYITCTYIKLSNKDHILNGCNYTMFRSNKDLTLLTPTSYEFRVSIKMNEHILHMG